MSGAGKKGHRSPGEKEANISTSPTACNFEGLRKKNLYLQGGDYITTVGGKKGKEHNLRGHDGYSSFYLQHLRQYPFFREEEERHQEETNGSGSLSRENSTCHKTEAVSRKKKRGKNIYEKIGRPVRVNSP